LCIFRPEPSNLQCQNLPMLHPLVWPLLSSFEDEQHLSFNLTFAEDTMEEQLVDVCWRWKSVNLAMSLPSVLA
jgi:hypothetical protein